MKKSLQSLIEQGKTKQAIQQLIGFTRSDRDLHQHALALSGRFQKYLQDKHAGTEDRAELNAELNRINAAVLNLIERTPHGTQAINQKWSLQRLVFGLGIFVAIAGITSYGLKDSFKNKKEPNVVVTPESEQNALDTLSGTSEVQDTTLNNPAKTNEAKNNVYIEVKDQGKVGTVLTGDSNKIDIKQDF